MKRIIILVIMALMSFSASAASIRYFTNGQAARTVNYLNTQNEMMIYCGYEYEIETYVLINEVWAERVNSSYYELWVFGYDAYTGEEIYMPLDLQCVWLFDAGHIYNAAQYLRFHAAVRMPQFAWNIPAYNHFTRINHHPGYSRTYHYNVHCYGWMPPAPPHDGYWGGPGMPPPPMPHYYLRYRNEPAPHPSQVWTPGVERPHITIPDSYGRGTTVRTRPSSSSGNNSVGRSTGNSVSNQAGTRTRTESSDNKNSRSSATTLSSRSRNGNASSAGTNSNSTATATRTRNTGTTPTRENSGARSVQSTEANIRSNNNTATRDDNTRTRSSSTANIRNDSRSDVSSNTNTIRSNNNAATRSDNTRTRSSSTANTRSNSKSDVNSNSNATNSSLNSSTRSSANTSSRSGGTSARTRR